MFGVTVIFWGWFGDFSPENCTNLLVIFQYLGLLAQNWNKRANPQNRTMFGSYWSRKVWLVHLIISGSKHQGPLCMCNKHIYVYIFYLHIYKQNLLCLYTYAYLDQYSAYVYTCRYVLVSIHSFGRVISRKVDVWVMFICSSSDPAESCATGCLVRNMLHQRFHEAYRCLESLTKV